MTEYNYDYFSRFNSPEIDKYKEFFLETIKKHLNESDNGETIESITVHYISTFRQYIFEYKERFYHLNYDHVITDFTPMINLNGMSCMEIINFLRYRVAKKFTPTVPEI